MFIIIVHSYVCIIRHVHMCRCIQLNSLDNAICNDGFIQESHNVIFDYTTEENFIEYIQTLDNLEELLRTSGEDQICQDVTAYFLCNYVFIPCNLTTGNPRPLCTVPCEYYVNERCANIFETIFRFSSIVDYPLMNDCPNTLSHLETFGLSLESDSFADDCIDIAGTYVQYGLLYHNIICCINTALVEPNLTIPDSNRNGGGGNDMASGDSSSSGIVIGASVVGSLLALGVIVFLVVLLLLIRHKRKTSKYNTSLMAPTKVLYNQNGYVSSLM